MWATCELGDTKRTLRCCTLCLRGRVSPRSDQKYKRGQSCTCLKINVRCRGAAIAWQRSPQPYRQGRYAPHHIADIAAPALSDLGVKRFCSVVAQKCFGEGQRPNLSGSSGSALARSLPEIRVRAAGQRQRKGAPILE